MLISRFKETRMKDNESFDEFYAKLNDIVNHFQQRIEKS